MPVDIQKLLDRLAKVGEKTPDPKTKEQLSALIRQLRQALQELENNRNDLLARMSQHTASQATLTPGTTAPPASTTATPLDLANSFRKVIDTIQTEARQASGVATTIKSMDIEVKGLVQVNEEKETLFVLPNPGSPIDANSLSTLRVSFGSIPVAAPATAPAVTVPNVVGKPRSEVEGILENAGLQVGRVDPQVSTTPAGTVLQQTPQAGEQVAAGTAVNLVTAITAITVPHVVGLTLTKASEVIVAAKLRVGRVEVTASSPAFDMVIGQRPIGGAQVAPGDPVDLTLGRPPR